MPCPSPIHTWGSLTCSLSLLLYLKIILFIFILFGYAVSSLLCSLSLRSESGGYSLVAMHGILIAVASLVAEHGI